MKNLVLLVLATGGLFYANSKTTISNHLPIPGDPDTITFTLRHPFDGRCDSNCYKFLGTNCIETINNEPIGKNCNHIYVNCPSTFDLKSDVSYTFIALPFMPQGCSTIIDTCDKNVRYLLVKEME